MSVTQAGASATSELHMQSPQHGAALVVVEVEKGMIQVSSSSSRQLIQPPRWHRPCPRHRRRLLQAAGPVAVAAVAEEASVGAVAEESC